jgi:quercetin dioxygenase-like cupin family protein
MSQATLMTEAKYIPVAGGQAKLLPPDGGRRFQPSASEEVFFKMGGDEVEGLFDYFEIRVGYLDGPPLHIHSIQHETFHIIEGHLTVKVGDNLVEAHPGDFLYIPKGVVHTYANLTEGTIARAVGNLSPGGFDKFVAELNAYQKSVSQQDPKIIAEISAKHSQVFCGPPLAVLLGLKPARA